MVWIKVNSSISRQFFKSIKRTVFIDPKFAGAVIVSTPQKVALADARKGIDMFKKVNLSFRAVRN